jgi:DME family drug/metabolite transporter
MSATRASILSVVFAGILFGTAGTAQALGPGGTTPLGVGALRLMVGALALLVVMPLIGHRPSRVLALWRTPAIVFAALGAAAFQVCFFASVSQVGVAVGTLVAVGSSPIFAGLLGWVVLGHRPTRVWLLATAVCIVGLVLRSGGDLSGGEAVGLLLALAAGLSSATYTVAAKHQLDRGVATIEVPAAAFALGGLLLVPVLLTQPLSWVAQPAGVVLVLYLGLVTMALANSVLGHGIGGLTPGPVTTLLLTDPLVATLLGVVVLNETLTPIASVGLLLVLVGLVLQGGALARDAGETPEAVPVL